MTHVGEAEIIIELRVSDYVWDKGHLDLRACRKHMMSYQEGWKFSPRLAPPSRRKAEIMPLG